MTAVSKSSPKRTTRPVKNSAAATPVSHISVMDTTLRDGEQTPNVSYTPAEKLQLARMLLVDLEVDRIEIASTRVSEGELEAAQSITKWARKARLIQRVEMLGYSDGKKSVDWICNAGGKVMNLLTKGSERHCTRQLGMTPEAHREGIAETIRYARRKRLSVNVYLEDWSSGVRDSFDYVFSMVELLRELRVARIFLADTLGTFAPADVTRYVGLMTATWPAVDFEFHGHNDYGLAVANCLAATLAGARGVHTSVNGMGERAGNTSLAEVVAALHDHTKRGPRFERDRLTSLSDMVATFSGKEMSANTPIVGRDVYTQTAGIHADGDAKGDLYATRLAPTRFGGHRRYALGKLSGKASLDHNLEEMGIALPDADRDLVLQRIVELGDRKHIVTPEDLALSDRRCTQDACGPTRADRELPGRRFVRRSTRGARRPRLSWHRRKGRSERRRWLRCLHERAQESRKGALDRSPETRGLSGPHSAGRTNRSTRRNDSDLADRESRRQRAAKVGRDVLDARRRLRPARCGHHRDGENAERSGHQAQ